MDHDALVQFAAEKVGVEIAYADDGLGWQYMSAEHDGWWNFDLTSPDLFLKGLGVYYKEGAPFQISPWGVKLGFQNMTFDAIERIPEMFWQCWAEVEGK